MSFCLKHVNANACQDDRCCCISHLDSHIHIVIMSLLISNSWSGELILRFEYGGPRPGLAGAPKHLPYCCLARPMLALHWFALPFKTSFITILYFYPCGDAIWFFLVLYYYGNRTNCKFHFPRL